MSNTYKDAILAKVATMKTTVLSSCNSCGNTPDQSGQTGAQKAKAAYTTSFTHLTNAIEAYYTALSQQQSKLYDIITFDFIREMTSGYVFNPPNYPYPTENLPVGESDYLLLYGMNGLYNQIMNYSNNYYFTQDACLTGESAPAIETDVSGITSATTSDVQLQQTFIDWLRYYPNKNQLINVTENQTMTMESSTMPNKTTIGTKIYITKHAKAIIEAFDFDIYIPTYVRS